MVLSGGRGLLLSLHCRPRSVWSLKLQTTRLPDKRGVRHRGPSGFVWNEASNQSGVAWSNKVKLRTHTHSPAGKLAAEFET